MALRHVVVFQLRGDTPSDQRELIVNALRELPGLIPTVRSYVVGVDAKLREDNFDVAIVADFDDVAGFETYRDHPEHQRVIRDHIAAHVASRAAVQHQLD